MSCSAFWPVSMMIGRVKPRSRSLRQISMPFPSGSLISRITRSGFLSSISRKTSNRFSASDTSSNPSAANCSFSVARRNGSSSMTRSRPRGAVSHTALLSSPCNFMCHSIKRGRQRFTRVRVTRINVLDKCPGARRQRDSDAQSVTLEDGSNLSEHRSRMSGTPPRRHGHAAACKRRSMYPPGGRADR